MQCLPRSGACLYFNVTLGWPKSIQQLGFSNTIIDFITMLCEINALKS